MSVCLEGTTTVDRTTLNQKTLNQTTVDRAILDRNDILSKRHLIKKTIDRNDIWLKKQQLIYMYRFLWLNNLFVTVNQIHKKQKPSSMPSQFAFMVIVFFNVKVRVFQEVRGQSIFRGFYLWTSHRGCVFFKSLLLQFFCIPFAM